MGLAPSALQSRARTLPATLPQYCRDRQVAVMRRFALEIVRARREEV